MQDLKEVNIYNELTVLGGTNVGGIKMTVQKKTVLLRILGAALN